MHAINRHVIITRMCVYLCTLKKSNNKNLEFRVRKLYSIATFPGEMCKYLCLQNGHHQLDSEQTKS